MNIENYKQTFNCCGKSYLLNIEYIKQEYYKMLFKVNNKFFNKVLQDEYFGKNRCSFNKLQQIHYLWNIIYMIYKDMRIFYNLYITGRISLEQIPNANYYKIKYNLECIRKSMKCIGIDIIPLLKLIGLNYIVDIKDGIDYMAITPHSSEAPDFRIFKD